MEVDVGDAVARMAVLEDAEHEALPWFGMERAIEKGAALDGLPADGDRQGIMPRGGVKECADCVGRLGRFEGDRSAMGPGGAVVQDDMGPIAAEEVNRLQRQAVAWAWVPAGDAPAQRAAPAREGEKPEPGGIFRLGDAGLPVAFAEGQQDCGIGDPGAVIGEGNAGAIAILLDGHGNARGAATAGILQRLGENIGEASRKQPGHLVDGTVADAGADRGGTIAGLGRNGILWGRHAGSPGCRCGNEKRPAGLKPAGRCREGRTRWFSRGAGMPVSPAAPLCCRGRCRVAVP